MNLNPRRRVWIAILAEVIGGSAVAIANGAQWTIPAVVDVKRIESVAVSDLGAKAAYVIKEPSVATDSVNYALYEVSLNRRAQPRRLLQAKYMRDVTRSPSRGYWTVLADIGSGVQLYDIKENVIVPVASSPNIVTVGGYSADIAGSEKPHRAGIFSYEWSPDGTELWYSTFRVRDAAQAKVFMESGVEYDDRKYGGFGFRNDPGKILGLELHVERLHGGGNHIVAFLPFGQFTSALDLRRDLASAMWMADSRHVEYTRKMVDQAGRLITSSWLVDVRTGARRAAPKGSPWWVLAVPSADDHGYYSVAQVGGVNHLIKYGADGRVLNDDGRTGALMVGMMRDYPGGTWSDKETGEQILSVLYRHHIGLMTLPKSPVGRAWAEIRDNLNPCDFSRDLRIGVCVEQSQTLPPELVVVDGKNGTRWTVAEPNRNYKAIVALKVRPEQWTNKFGQRNDGYIVYPRQFLPGHKYPLIIVTHGDGAINTFADQGMIQADIPVQVLAEDGYVVVEANTPWRGFGSGKAAMYQFNRLNTSMSAVRQKEREFIQEPVASMEAVVEALAQSGVIDAAKVGISGYSEGALLSLFAMTQSKVFRVASIDEGASGAAADGYWEDGFRSAPFMYQALYGGSALSSDPRVLNAYRRFCPDFRAASFAGPLLEQVAAGTAKTAFARLVFLREAGIPHDLLFYPDESHVFWDPRARAASMERTLEWFDYWLLGRRSPARQNVVEYQRWDSMRDLYEKRCPECLTGLGPWTPSPRRHSSDPTVSRTN
ncbi:MAG TPA: prolyl oligopeptidase family serine peptidase [Steroidobacteraceae bacterium]|nr:prolyl oligopeptidase family serine peptidase [Steroidobacteraceae bacterium]